MLKSLAVATTALVITGSSLVYAQHFGGPGDAGGGGLHFLRHYHPTIQDRKAFTDARIAALKAGLQLTPDQEKNWPSFEQALREMAQLRIARIEARQAAQGDQQADKPATPFDRMEHRADAMSKRGAALKHVADTGAPLYQSLTDAQKTRFKVLAIVLRPHHHHWFANRGEGHHGWDHGWARRGDREDGRWRLGRGDDGASQNQGPGDRGSGDWTARKHGGANQDSDL